MVATTADRAPGQHRSVDSALLDELEGVGIEMTRELFPEVIGEVNTSGCPSPGDYPYLQPVKVVELALLIGKRAGYGMNELHPLVMAALLKDVGYAAVPSDITGSEESPEAQQHSLYGTEIISGYRRFGPEVAEAVYQHHERWDGSGYPEGLKGKEASAFARILAIADAYYGLVSNRPDRENLMPHEAIEYIMAYSGELFDPELVDIFAKSVPLYPIGRNGKAEHGRGRRCVQKQSRQHRQAGGAWIFQQKRTAKAKPV